VAVTEVIKYLGIVNTLVFTAVGQLTGVVGLHITTTDVKAILSLVITLVNEIVSIVEEVVSVLGLEPALTVILNTVFQTVAGLLTLVTGLVGGIIPGLIDTVTPILESFDGSALGPILTPVAGVLEGLTA
jgi:phage-related protein